MTVILWQADLRDAMLARPCVCLSQVGVLLKRLSEYRLAYGMGASVDLSYSV